jgi:hypothetical protein
MDYQSRLFDEIKTVARMQMAKEILEGIQEIDVNTYTQAQTISRVVQIVEGAKGI